MLKILNHPDPWHGLTVFLERVLDKQAKDRGLKEVLMGLAPAPLIGLLKAARRCTLSLPSSSNALFNQERCAPTASRRTSASSSSRWSEQSSMPGPMLPPICGGATWSSCSRAAPTSPSCSLSHVQL